MSIKIGETYEDLDRAIDVQCGFDKVHSEKNGSSNKIV